MELVVRGTTGQRDCQACAWGKACTVGTRLALGAVQWAEWSWSFHIWEHRSEHTSKCSNKAAQLYHPALQAQQTWSSMVTSLTVCGRVWPSPELRLERHVCRCHIQLQKFIRSFKDWAIERYPLRWKPRDKGFWPDLGFLVWPTKVCPTLPSWEVCCCFH